MPDSPFDHISASASYFIIPQCEDIFQSVLNDIGNFRLLSCVTGFPKAGKTVFANRLVGALRLNTILLKASAKCSLSKTLHAQLALHGAGQDTLGAQLKHKKRIIVIIDNAHLLRDEDFAFISGLYTLAEQLRAVLQMVLLGNGEIIQRISRPDNRMIYNMLGTLRNLPKLTKEQGLAYVRFLLDSAGLSQDIIPNPDPLIKRAAGSIGVLRTLTITLALKALSGQEVKDVDGILALKSQSYTPDFSTAPSDDDMPVQEMVAPSSPWIGRTLFLSMSVMIGLFVLVFYWFVPGTSLHRMMLSGFQEVMTATRDNRNPQALNSSPGTDAAINGANTAVQGPPQPVAKTVFRKRTKDGPYSIQIGTYATAEAMLLHLPRFADIGQPLMWARSNSSQIKYELFAGRFQDFAMATEFASQKRLANTQVVFRPYMATIGPLTDTIQLRNASFMVGLPELQGAFLRDLISGREVQFALERTKEEALAKCKAAEDKGLSCAVTQYE